MRIVYITNGMASTLNSSFELTRRLIESGHEVTYVSPADVIEQVEAQGLRCVRLSEDTRFQAAVGEPVPPTSPLRWLRSLARRRRLRRQSIANDEIERVVSELAPDLLLIDMEMHFAIVATAAAKVPTFLPIVWFSVFKQPELPPMHTDLPPGDSWQRRLRIRVAWWRLRLETLHGEWRDRLRRTLRGDVFRPVAYDTFAVDDVRAVARARGFPFARETDRRHWLRPHVYRRKPVLCFNAWEMELPHRRRSGVHYVGPMVRLDRQEALLDADSAARWSRFVKRREGGAAGARPLVYCSLGTYWSMDRDFLRRVLDVFETRPDWDLVLGLGGKLEADGLAPLPANALVLDFAPQLEVLRRADCAITHGGITTINECVELGVPMVVYSTRHVDQNGCAVRVGHHGLGIVGDKDADDLGAMEGKIERALTDSTIRGNVQAMSACFREYRESGEAVRILEQAVRRGGGR